MSFAYDLAGNRTQITWPDSFYAGYAFDNDGRLITVNENGAVSGVGVLANYTFGSQLTLSGISLGNGVSTGLGYDSAFRLNSLAQSFTGSGANVTFGLSYNTANQALNRTSTNDLYTGHAGNLSTAYTANGLNQYATVGAATYTYDGRGNMTSDGTRTFGYDIENRLLSEHGGPVAVAAFSYDPLGRMQTSTAGGSTTTFLRAGGDQLMAEYNGSTLLRRYVPGASPDQPVVWYEGAGTTDRRWLQTDQQGSVIGWSDSSGVSNAVYTYDPYGNPGSWTGSRYSYTGQLMIPEAALYYYKARVYDPASGRFLQTDPIGYQSDINTYAYVRNAPINNVDPTGTTEPACQPDNCPGIVPCPGGSNKLCSDPILLPLPSGNDDDSGDNDGFGGPPLSFGTYGGGPGNFGGGGGGQASSQNAPRPCSTPFAGQIGKQVPFSTGYYYADAGIGVFAGLGGSADYVAGVHVVNGTIVGAFSGTNLVAGVGVQGIAGVGGNVSASLPISFDAANVTAQFGAKGIIGFGGSVSASGPNAANLSYAGFSGNAGLGVNIGASAGVGGTAGACLRGK